MSHSLTSSQRIPARIRSTGLPWYILIAIIILFVSGCTPPQTITVVGPSTEQRAIALQKLAEQNSLNFQFVAAKLKTGINTALAWRQLDTLLTTPQGDVFWLYPAVGFYFNCKDQLSLEWQERFRKMLGTYAPYRGDTENHFLMYYTSLFLFSQEWPDMTGEEWFNGKSSQENYREAKGYLNHWVEQTVRYGTTEWDSPRYLYFYITPILLMRDFSQDLDIQKRFDMMLEYELADFAVEYLDGSYCGAHSRDADGAVIDPRSTEVTPYAYFYFEKANYFPSTDLVYGALSSFQCPEIIRSIAQDRHSAFVHQELKRSRAKMRFSEEKYAPVYKYDYITSSYCLGSIQGGIVQPIQQHSWDITFASENSHNTVFGLHPYASEDELGMFFPEEPELMLRTITKASYGTPNKWVGGSPYERIWQWKNQLVATYSLPPNIIYQHIDLFIPKSLDNLLADTLGWTIGRMGKAFFALRLINPQKSEWFEEDNNWRLRSFDPTTTYFVECSSEEEMSFTDFIHRLTDMHGIQFTKADSTYHLDPDAYARMSMDNIRAKQERQRNDSMLFEGPYLQSKKGSGILQMHYNGSTRILDFNRNEVIEH